MTFQEQMKKLNEFKSDLARDIGLAKVLAINVQIEASKNPKLIKEGIVKLSNVMQEHSEILAQIYIKLDENSLDAENCRTIQDLDRQYQTWNSQLQLFFNSRVLLPEQQMRLRKYFRHVQLLQFNAVFGQLYLAISKQSVRDLSQYASLNISRMKYLAGTTTFAEFITESEAVLNSVLKADLDKQPTLKQMWNTLLNALISLVTCGASVVYSYATSGDWRFFSAPRSGVGDQCVLMKEQLKCLEEEPTVGNTNNAAAAAATY